MTFRSLIATALILAPAFATAGDHKLKSVAKAPEGLAPVIAKLVDPAGHQIVGPDGAVIEIWLLKSVPVKPGFKPNFTQFYPFQPGQLLGAMRIPKGTEYTDFKGQQMQPGTYTLRYGLQPMDGNHVGTSETYDFILALPAKADTKTDAIEDFYELSEISAKSAGSTHPAILSLLDPAKVAKEPKLEEDSFTEHWILSFTAQGDAKGKKAELKVRLVVVGQFEG